MTSHHGCHHQQPSCNCSSPDDAQRLGSEGEKNMRRKRVEEDAFQILRSQLQQAGYVPTVKYSKLDGGRVCAILNLQKHGTCRQYIGRAASSKDEARLLLVDAILEDDAMMATLSNLGIPRHIQTSEDFIAGKRRSHKHSQDDTCSTKGHCSSSGQGMIVSDA
ncbi:unnamed protein product [Symbiodinium natans]|uniref:Uncharacterized protein n=1 Tax=Symbiodinium natans TaxID=878477 RepID=A0A812Q253_9DINO|nr:unnamed protein product [Symbiodinium natans]